MITDKTTLKSWFKTGLKPTQEQFSAWMDAYWHKSEKLSINDVKGLGAAIDGKAAANHTHSEYAFSKDLSRKLDKPLVNNTADYVLLADGSTADKTAFGKVNTVMGKVADANKNVDISDVAMNWTNASQRFSAITDKSSDATFNSFALFDNLGNMAKASFIGNAFESALNGISQQQALRIGHLLNGGVGSDGMMSVNMISPPYIKLENGETYVVLRGANLYLNNDNYKVSITDTEGNVLVDIPNSQVQLRNIGTELVFYYNFTLLGEGRYKLRLVSGVKMYQTTLSFEVVQNMEVVNLNALTWDVLEQNGNASSASVISPTSITLNRLVNDTTTYLPTISAKSSTIFSVHENWMIEYEVTFSMNLGSGQQGLSKTIVGIDYSSSQHNLVASGVAYVYWNKIASAGHMSEARFYASPSTLYGISTGSGGSGSSHSHVKVSNVIMVKTGNMITVNVDGVTSTNVVTNGESYSFIAQISGRTQTNTESLSVRLINAYKF